MLDLTNAVTVRKTFFPCHSRRLPLSPFHSIPFPRTYSSDDARGKIAPASSWRDSWPRGPRLAGVDGLLQNMVRRRVYPSRKCPSKIAPSVCLRDWLPVCLPAGGFPFSCLWIRQPAGCCLILRCRFLSATRVEGVGRDALLLSAADKIRTDGGGVGVGVGGGGDLRGEL